MSNSQHPSPQSASQASGWPSALPSPTPEQSRQLSEYTKLLKQWSPRINLVAPSTLAEVETRHILDSAQLVPHVPPAPRNHPQTLLDVGSGAGLPGLILGILCPATQVTLVERDSRKAAFLLTAKQALGLANVTVLNMDVTEIKNQFDVITARAFAPLEKILTLTNPLLFKGGSWLLLKGKAFPEELSTCETTFHLTVERWPSIVAPEGWVVRLTPR